MAEEKSFENFFKSHSWGKEVNSHGQRIKELENFKDMTDGVFFDFIF